MPILLLAAIALAQGSVIQQKSSADPVLVTCEFAFYSVEGTFAATASKVYNQPVDKVMVFLDATKQTADALAEKIRLKEATLIAKPSIRTQSGAAARLQISDREDPGKEESIDLTPVVQEDGTIKLSLKVKQTVSSDAEPKYSSSIKPMVEFDKTNYLLISDAKHPSTRLLVQFKLTRGTQE